MMIKIEKIEDIYPAIDELIIVLDKNDKQRYFSKVLKHRMYEVAWTTRSELLEEISKVLKDLIESKKNNLDDIIRSQIDEILNIIRK